MRFIPLTLRVRVMWTAVLVLSAGVAQAQERGAPATGGVPAEVLAVQDLVFSLYPELLERPLDLRVIPVGGAWVVEVADALPSPDLTLGRPAEAVTPAPLLTATVHLDAARQLVAYRATGLLVEQTRNDALQQQLRAHPEWADSDAEVWLMQAGGRPTTGAPAPAASDVATQPWRRFLGANVTTEQAWFRWGAERSDGTPVPRTAASVSTTSVRDGAPPWPSSVPPPPIPVVRPTWIVEASGVDATGAPVRYRLEFEPFGGRLVGAVRQ